MTDDEHQPLPPDESVAPERIRMLVCDCGTIAEDFAHARCGLDRRRNIRSGCPARWVTLQYVDEVGA